MEKSYTYKIKPLTLVNVLIIDLTYMKTGVCIAGINLNNFRNIRPVRFSDHIQMDFIERNGIYPCAIVTFEGMQKYNVLAPHTEDFNVKDSVVFRRFVSQEEWLELLKRCASESLPDRLKHTIQEDKWIPPETDVPSLSLIELRSRPVIRSIKRKEGGITDIRVSFISGGREFLLKVNDIQIVGFLENRHKIRMQENPGYGEEVFLQEINDELFTENAYYYIRVGLTRPYQERCWLQINGIFTERSDVLVRRFTTGR